MTSRELEIQQVEMAIAKTEAARQRARDTLDRLYEKLMRQQAELRFQKLMAKLEKRTANPDSVPVALKRRTANAGTEPAPQ